MYANILTDGATVLTPIGIPVWPVPRPFFAFTAALFATTSKLLTIGNFIIHEFISYPPTEKVARVLEAGELLLPA
jgi:hypothetical protein